MHIISLHNLVYRSCKQELKKDFSTQNIRMRAWGGVAVKALRY